jgi:hypothetical protein
VERMDGDGEIADHLAGVEDFLLSPGRLTTRR